MDDKHSHFRGRGGGRRGRRSAAAVKVAKAFQDKLEAAGISYKLLALEEARRMNDLAHHILLGWENGRGFPHE